MKVTNVKEIGHGKYELTLVPNWLEKLFGKKPGKLILKNTDRSYMVGGQNIYIDKEGTSTSNGSPFARAIDKFRRSKTF